MTEKICWHETDRLITLIDEVIQIAAADHELQNTESILRIARKCVQTEKSRLTRQSCLN